VWYSEERQDHLTCALDSTVAWAKTNGYKQTSENIGYVFTEPHGVGAALELY
jgi:hypothetical protein